MKIIPRTYQDKAVHELRVSFRKNRSVLYVLPTGGGKTMVYALIASGAIEKGNRVIVSVHRQELLRQIVKNLADIDIPCGVITAKNTTEGLIQVASTQTLVKRLDQIEPPRLLICEEAHHSVNATNRKIIDSWPETQVLGVTATPERLDGTGLGVVYHEMIIGPSVVELQEQGFLAKMRYFVPPPVAQLEGLKLVAGDYEKQEVAIRMDKPHVTGDAIDHYLKLGNAQRAIVFCTSIKHAEQVAAAFRARHVPAASIDGTMSEAERRQKIADLEAGKLYVLTSCELIGEGLDIPAVGVAILLRPTASLVFHLQAIGRAMRPAVGKEYGIVIDHVGNCLRHGPAELEREWSLVGAKRAKKSANESVPLYRRCPKCFAMFPSAKSHCPQCGTEGVKSRAEIKQIEGELKEAEIASLKFAATSERKAAKTLEELVALGIKRGYKNPHGWANHVYYGRQRQG